MEREEKSEVYRIRCSSEENNVEDDIEGGIDAGCAPEAPWHRVPVAAIKVETPLRFFVGSTIVGVF